MRQTTFSALSDLAAEQRGLVTSRQAAEAGIPKSTWERLIADRSVLERVARGVYRFVIVPPADHLALLAAWLQLAPAVPAWERRPNQGIVSYRSAASLYGLGHLPADTHEFTVTGRKQSRRLDVRIHQRAISAEEWARLGGLIVTRPARIASDLLADQEDPESVGHVIADAIRGGQEQPRAIAEQIGKHAARFGLRRGDGVQLLRWLLDLVGDPGSQQWMTTARASVDIDDDHERYT
jgi:predicted transcriptional regulator of viral defense system